MTLIGATTPQTVKRAAKKAPIGSLQTIQNMTAEINTQTQPVPGQTTRPPPLTSSTDSAGSPAPQVRLDVPDNLTARLPAGLRAQALRLQIGTGIDSASAAVVTTALVSTWAGDQLRVTTGGGLKIPCIFSCVLGLPVGVSSQRMDVALFDDIAAEELKVIDHYLEKLSSARQDRRLVRQQRLQPARVRSFIRNPVDRVACTVARTSFAAEILTGFTGDEWIDPIIRGARSNDAHMSITALGGTTDRRTRLMSPGHFRSVDNPEVWEVRHSLIATASAERIRTLANQDGYARICLTHAIKFIANVVARSEPPSWTPDTDAWLRLLSRATKIRTGEMLEITAPPDVNQMFDVWHNGITARFEQMEPIEARTLHALYDLPLHLFGVLHFADEDGTCGPMECAKLAMDLARWIKDRTFELHNGGVATHLENAREDHRERLLRKIIERGPLTRRELLRSETVQRWDEHSDEIYALIRTKRIELDQWGRYRALPVASMELSASTKDHHAC